MLALSLFPLFVGCGNTGGSSAPVSKAEAHSLSEDVFESPADPGTQFRAEDGMSEIVDQEDARVPNLPLQSGQAPTYVQRCRPESYEQERVAALALAAADPTGATIPVRYQISVGTAFDTVAHNANQRAILRSNDDGITPIPVGPMNTLSFHKGAHSFHYEADHRSARAQFLSGEKCYFSTVKAVKAVAGSVLNPKGVYDHALNLMYYGVTYTIAAGQTIQDVHSPRLFGCLQGMMTSANNVKCSLPPTAQPQFINLYVADLREESFGLQAAQGQVIHEEFIQNSVRQKEYMKSFKDIFDFKVLFTQRDHIARSLMKSQTKGTLVFSGLEGAPQLIDNIIFSGLKGTVMSTQYTPIVLDLGTRNVRTSSLDWGTFFNLANLRAGTGGTAKNVSHLTAWLSGPLEMIDFNSSSKWARRVLEDGLLIRPDAGTSIQNATQLFSSFTQVNNKTFADGFQALREMTAKDCQSTDIRRKYVGPWDAAYSQLKIWIDRDRNGVSEAAEMKGLKELGIAAINSCNVVHSVEMDMHGNGTALRSAFLLLAENDRWIIDEQEALVATLQSGLLAGSDQTADFRLAIDIFFKTQKDMYLENFKPVDVRTE